MLAVIPDEDRSKGARLGEYRTVEQMAYRPAEHFAEHAAHLRHILGLENGVAEG